MFVALVDIKIKPENIENFKTWFSESNKIVSKFDGFISRRLLGTKDGQYRVLVEFENSELFRKMHQSPEHEQIHPKGVSLMDGMPSPTFYDVISQ